MKRKLLTVVSCFTSVVGVSAKEDKYGVERILFGSGLTLGTSAFRTRFLNMFVDEQDTNTHLVIDEMDKIKRPEDISNYYFPTYMTDGYLLDSYTVNNDIQDFLFISNDGYIDFTLYYVSEDMDISVQIDSEDTEVKEITVKKSKGLYTEKDNLVTLSWIEEEYLFTFAGNVDIEEMKKIVENIKYFK